MSTSPSITVIVSVYNGASYLKETLESVLAQSLAPAKLIVVDDGSTDRSACIAREFGEHLTLVSTANQKLAASRNFGATLATSDWIHFLDHDDLWTSDHLAELMETIRSHPQADVCYSGRRNLVEDRATGEFRLGPALALPAPHELADVLMTRCPFMHSSVALRRSKFLAVGGVDPRYNAVEDWDLWVRLHWSGAQFVHSAAPTLHYRVHRRSMTNNPLPVLDATLDFLRNRLVPHLPPRQRSLHWLRISSRLQSEAAVLLRENGAPGYLRLMLRSLIRLPLFERRRYLIAAHMLLTRLGRGKTLRSITD